MIKENCYWYEYDNDMGARIPYCKIHGDDVLESCDNCEQYHSKYEATNADVIRAMSDEGLANWFKDIDDNCPGRLGCRGQSCYDCWLSWLRSPADKEETNG